tara:strand:- start:421 stop:636 length:216 start_codon:yes stop_codon:yes gene_type:complete
MLSIPLQIGPAQILIVLIVIAIIGLIPAIWGMNVTKKKGQPKGLGFLLGFVFSLVGVIICYVLPDKTKSSD